MRNLIARTAAVVVFVLPTFSSAQVTLTSNLNAVAVTANVGSTAINATFNGFGTTKVGAFKLTLGAPLGGTVVDNYCVDLNNYFYNGQHYSANLTLLSSSYADIASRTRQGMTLGSGATGISLYLKLAWLADKFATESTTQWGGIQGAIWDLEAPGTPISPTLNPSVQYWLTQVASANLSSIDRTKWAVVTDVTVHGAKGGAQEFLIRTNVVPEPSTYALMATGCIGLTILARRRSRA